MSVLKKVENTVISCFMKEILQNSKENNGSLWSTNHTYFQPSQNQLIYMYKRGVIKKKNNKLITNFHHKIFTDVNFLVLI